MREPGAEVPAHEVPVQLRWADMDVNRHVNNVAVLRLLEEARVRFFSRELRLFEAGVSLVVAHQEIDYAIPLLYSEESAAVRMWITRIGTSGFTVGAHLYDGQAVLAARSETSLVVIDGAGRPTPISEPIRSVLAAASGPPVGFRRRVRDQ